MKSDSWRIYKLDELFEFSSGLSKKRSEFGFGFSFLTFKEVFHNVFVPKELSELANTSEKERLKCSIKRGDIFLTRTSEKLDELGLSSVALYDYPEATFNGFTKRLRPKKEIKDSILPEYIAFYLRSPEFRNQITAMASMTTRASLNNSMLAKLTVKLPPIEVQSKIANILNSLYIKAEINGAIISNLEELAQTLFKRWFINFEFPNEKGDSYLSSGGKMVESELGLIPEEWEVDGLSGLGSIVGGGTPSKKVDEYFTDDGVGWITPKDLSNNKSIFIEKGATDITEEALQKSSAKLLPENSILFSSRAPIGYVSIAGRPVSTNQGFKSIVPNLGIPSEFVFFLLKHLTPNIEANAGGSTFKEISGSGMKAIKVVFPPDYLLSKFKEIVGPLFIKIKNLEKETRILNKTRDTLLPKLLSGEIEIPVESEELEHV